MPDFFTQLDWKIHVFIVGLAIAGTCSLLSPYVVLRRMALVSEGVSHAGFGGIAVAMLAGYAVSAFDNEIASRIITGIFCLATALLIAYVTRQRKVSEDSAIGIFLVATVALGDILLTIRRQLPVRGAVPASVEQLLFGDFLGVSPIDSLAALAAALFCFLVILLLFWQFLYITLDEEMARVNGVRTGLLNFLLLLMISLVIVIGVRMVGFLMITAMTIIPGATANLLSRRFSSVLLFSLAVGILGTLFALLLAFGTQLKNFPPGPIIVLTLFLIFAVTWLFRHLVKPKPAAHEAA